jgi:hypothetical protein
MATPQPPDLGETGPVPEDNRPGHHPPVEQDKPASPPKLAERHHRFRFRRDVPLALAGLPFGITDENAYVDVDDDRLEIRFGPWTMKTPTDNVLSAERTGPYAWWKVVGPPRMSLKDRGITFATTSEEGVCLRFREPVAGGLPNSLVRHPGATVTVEDPEDLVEFFTRA